MSFIALLFFYALNVYFLCEGTVGTRKSFENNAGPIGSFVGLMWLLYSNAPTSPYLYHLVCSSSAVLLIYLFWLFVSTKERTLLVLNLIPSVGVGLTFWCVLKALPIIGKHDYTNTLHFFLIALTIQFIYFMKDFKANDNESFILYINDTHNRVS
jgi:hypothetical protein